MPEHTHTTLDAVGTIALQTIGEMQEAILRNEAERLRQAAEELDRLADTVRNLLAELEARP